MRGLNALSVALAIVALATLVAGPLGWRIGWWHYRTAFQTILPWAAYIGLGAVAAAALAFTAATISGKRGKWTAIICLLAGAIAAYFPWAANNQRGVHPGINDITTDTANPPQFVAAIPLRRTDGNTDGHYNKASTAVQEQHYFGLEPLKASLPHAETFRRAMAVAGTMPGWKLIGSDLATGRIEASHSSRWFGFTDDIVIRISDARGGGSWIDMRSASRHGRGDFGVNAKRIRAYREALVPHLQ